MGQSAAACCLYKRPGLRKKGVGRGGSSSLPQPALSSGLSVTTGRGVRMPLLGDGAGGEPQRLAQASQKPARGLGRVRWPCGVGSGGLFPAVLSLLVLFSEGAGMGHGGKSCVVPKATGRVQLPQSPHDTEPESFFPRKGAHALASGAHASVWGPCSCSWAWSSCWGVRAIGHVFSSKPRLGLAPLGGCPGPRRRSSVWPLSRTWDRVRESRASCWPSPRTRQAFFCPV